MKRIILLSILAGVVSLNLFSQDLCTVMGWASEYGSITGGGSATPVVCDTYDELADAIDNEDAVIHISGEITIPSDGRITIQDVDGLTIFGLPGSKLISEDLTSDGSGIFYIKRVTNLIIQNVVFQGPGAYDEDGYDNLCIDNCQGVWVDHCEFHDGMDGNFDIKNMSDYVSVTWCTFSYEIDPWPDGSGGSDDHRYSNLIGSSASATDDEGHLNTTFAYCWWGEGCRERMPRVRFGKIHLLNTYFSSSVSNYCARAGVYSNILIEGCYFDDQDTPVDIYKSSAVIAENNNITTGGSIDTQDEDDVFTPPYDYDIADASSIITPIESCAGATLPSFGGCSDCNGDITYSPTVSITSPSDGDSYSTGASVTITATASDSDGSIASVAFYDGSTLIGTSYSGYSVTISSLTEGDHTITATATDDDGLTTSTSITITASTPYTITETTSGSGVVSPDVSGTHYSGEELTTIAYPYIGYEFTGWTGDIESTEDSIGFTVTGDTEFVANFAATTDATVYEFEYGYWEDDYAAFENDHSGYSGSGYVNTVNASDTWTEITVYAPVEGTYSCELFYAVADDRPFSIAVDGTTQITDLSVTYEDWDTWLSTTFTLDLSADANVLRFTGTGSSGAPNLDRIEITSNMTTYTLTVNQATGGTVSPSSGDYYESTSVELTATPDDGYKFSNWTDDLSDSTSNPTTITMDADKTVSAVFTEIPDYDLTVTAETGGFLVSEVSGTYEEGTEVSFSVVECIGYTFSSWSGDYSSTEKDATISVDSTIEITANFSVLTTASEYEFEDGYYEEDYAVAETKNSGYSGDGYVNTVNAADTWTEITVYAASTGDYTADVYYAGITDRPMTITVNETTAGTFNGVATDDSVWTVWETETVTLALTEGENVIRFTATTSVGGPNLDKIAFNANTGTTYTLTVTQAAGGTISPSSGTYAEDATVSLTATPDDGYEFSKWSGDLSGTDNPATLTMDADKSITAVFTVEASETSISLKAGWNLIGYPLTDSLELSTALAQIWDYVYCVKDADGFYLSTQETYLNSLTVLEWGKGYFIYVTEACVLDWALLQD